MVPSVATPEGTGPSPPSTNVSVVPEIAFVHRKLALFGSTRNVNE
jgi:hypothetical protein